MLIFQIRFLVNSSISIGTAMTKTCVACNSRIRWGGEDVGAYSFCNDTCFERFILSDVVTRLDPEIVEQAIAEVHQGECPECGGDGPVDMHTSHRVWSVLVLTQWSSHPQLSCRSCATKAKLTSTLFCGVLGWWGFPFGLVMTPVQIIRNLAELAGGPRADEPSDELERLVKLRLGTNVLVASQQQKGAAPVFEDDDEVMEVDE